MSPTAELWGLVVACSLATFMWRGAGLLVSRRLTMDGPVLRLLACIAYATLAALVARIVILPAGILAETELWQRLAATAIALGVFFALRMNLLFGVIAGGAALVLIAV